jgi:drug/metabolite transporter (DMT)-like permease
VATWGRKVFTEIIKCRAFPANWKRKLANRVETGFSSYLISGGTWLRLISPKTSICAFLVVLGVIFLSVCACAGQISAAEEQHINPEIPVSFARWNLVIWANILYLGVFCSALAFFLYLFALKSLSSTVITSFINLVPFVSVLGARIFLGEPVSWTKLLGGILTVTGVYLVSSQDMPSTQAPSTKASQANRGKNEEELLYDWKDSSTTGRTP